MSGSQFGEQNLLNALQRYNNTVEQGSVAAGATTTSIPAQGSPGWETNQFIESLYFLEFLPGAVNAGLSRRITANTAAALTTVAFPDPPALADEFVIRHEPKGATDAMNLAEVGGTAQTPADWTPIFQAVRDRFPAVAALADAAANPSLSGIGSYLLGYNGVTWDRLRATIANGLAVDVTRIQGTVTTDTELPAAGALVDTTANPTAPAVGSFLHGFNGVTWDRLRTSVANGLVVDVSRVQGTVTVDSELPTAAALADATANPTVPGVGSFQHGFNGTTWDRLRVDSGKNLAVVLRDGNGISFRASHQAGDGMGDSTSPILYIANAGFNGVTWDRLRSTVANGLQVDVTRVQGTVTVDSELPVAAALADTAANPTVPGVGGFLMGFNGVTWDRLRSVNTGQLAITPYNTSGLAMQANQSGDSGNGSGLVATGLWGWGGASWDRLRSSIANGLQVDVTRVQGTVTVDTELPAASVLGDTTANPTVPGIGGFLLGFNGVTWDRLRATIANGLVVDVSRVQGTVTADTELPAAGVLTDAAANPTTPVIGAFLQGWNGATWDRIRTVNVGQPMVTQYTAAGVEVSARFIPIAKAAVFNGAAPGANTNILGSGVTPTNSPAVLRVTVLLATGSVFKARVTNSATTFDAKFNGGTALTASCVYTFDLPWRTGDSVNYQVETDGVIQMLRAEEIGAAA